MNAVSFLARDAADAVEQIHSRLGSDAVVLSVGQAPRSGLSPTLSESLPKRRLLRL